MARRSVSTPASGDRGCSGSAGSRSDGSRPGGTAIGAASLGTASLGTASLGTASLGTASPGNTNAGSACPVGTGSGAASASGGSGSGPSFAGSADALAAVSAGLGFLNGLAAAQLPGAELADCLRALEAARSAHLAAHAGVLAAFTAQAVYEDDGHGSPGAWLAAQTRVTAVAASRSVHWMKTLAAHPLVGEALAAGDVSESWARKVCDLSKMLPEGKRQDADRILLGAAAGGASLADLRGLAEEMLRRCAPPDPGDDDGGFGGRGVNLDTHFRGAGKLDGDLTPECNAALRAVFESLGKPAGPEDDRTIAQRQHDALEEVCVRAIAAGGMPDRAGQPTQVQLMITLDQLRGLDGAADAESAWLAGRAAGDGQPGWSATAKAAQAYACDAQITPVVIGHVDPGALAAMTAAYLAGQHYPACPAGLAELAALAPDAQDPASSIPRAFAGPGGGADTGRSRPASDTPGCTCASPVAHSQPLPARTRKRLDDTLLRGAAGVLSGPAGLAAYLRTGLLAAEFPAAVSLPLDVGAAVNTVPPHLRRAVIARGRHCEFGGCPQRPEACHAHHIVPRSKGGKTCLTNLVLLCRFHHLIAIHMWGWQIKLNADGTTTATSPDGKRNLHSHGPPGTGAV